MVDLTGICICKAFTSPNQTISTAKKRLQQKEQEQTADVIVKAQDDQDGII
jgi:hypothetical protein